MMPDGTMVLRNGRNDMDDRGWDKEGAELGGHKLGIERRTRWSEWSGRLDEIESIGHFGKRADNRHRKFPTEKRGEISRDQSNKAR